MQAMQSASSPVFLELAQNFPPTLDRSHQLALYDSDFKITPRQFNLPAQLLRQHATSRVRAPYLLRVAQHRDRCASIVRVSLQNGPVHFQGELEDHVFALMQGRGSHMQVPGCHPLLGAPLPCLVTCPTTVLPGSFHVPGSR